MIHVEPKDIEQRDVHHYMIGAIAPRPIALVSTISEDGKHNLAPFSFFCGLGSNPPMVCFSPARRGREGTLKDTYNNLLATKECVIQVVNYEIVEQVNLSSTDYAPGIDEFIKSGLTPVASDLIKPMRVAESPVQMECKLHQMINLGDKGGAGNAAICEIIKFHVSQDILDAEGKIDHRLIDLVGRNGGAYYTRAHGDALFEVAKPLKMIGMGYDKLPDFIKKSDTYTGNNLARFATLDHIPGEAEVKKFIEEQNAKLEKPALNFEASEPAFNRYKNQKDYQDMLTVLVSLKENGSLDKAKIKDLIEETAKAAIEADDIDFAWKTALLTEMWV